MIIFHLILMNCDVFIHYSSKILLKTFPDILHLDYQLH